MNVKNKAMNYGEFFALLKKLPGGADGLKEDLVSNFTNGRTTSLRQMTIAEYNSMCASMREGQEKADNKLSPDMFRIEIKRRRSAVLKRLQKLGVDTTNWTHIDNFCMNSKVAGKVFRKISIEELADLVPKLESMLRKKGTHDVDVPRNLIDMKEFIKN